MANFAVIKNNILSNLIIADSLEIAESVTGNKCVEYNEENDYVFIGSTYDGTSFIPPAPFKGWTYNKTTKAFEPPRPIPNETDPYDWDNETEDWKLINE